MTNLELILETEKYYTEDFTRRGISPRTSVNMDNCSYKIGEKYCAIGRIIDEDKLKENKLTFKVLNDYGAIDDMSYYLSVDKEISVYDLLKDEYKDIDFKLLEDLQFWHDTKAHWDEGLTVDGQEYINNLKQKYAIT